MYVLTAINQSMITVCLCLLWLYHLTEGSIILKTWYPLIVVVNKPGR